MNKRFSTIKIILTGTLCLISLLFIFLVTRADPNEKQLEGTRISLIVLRENLEKYRQELGGNPDSLSELNAHILKDATNKYTNRECKEYISSAEGLGIEYNKFNGKGGWFYDSSSGTVKVNLDKPLKYYFSNYYFWTRRNQVPSDW